MFCKLCCQWKAFQKAAKALNIAETNLLPEEQARCSSLFSVSNLFLIKVDKVCSWVLIDNDAQWTSCKNFWSFPSPKTCILTLNYFKAWGALFFHGWGKPRKIWHFLWKTWLKHLLQRRQKGHFTTPRSLQGNQVLKSCWQTFYFFLGVGGSRPFLHPSAQFHVYFSPKFTTKHMVAERNIGSVLFTSDKKKKHSPLLKDLLDIFF